jgi:hypothetical protein
MQLRDLRNIFVHADGRVSKEHKGWAFAKATPGLLEVDAHGRVTLAAGFVPHVLSVLRRFFDELYSSGDKGASLDLPPYQVDTPARDS